MLAPCLVILDLGGTNIGLYLLYSNLSISHKSIRTNRADPINQLVSIISEYTAEFDQLKFVIGLPGPYKPKTDFLFCPPLDRCLDLRPFNRLPVFICNDVISLLPVLFASNLLTPETLVLTVGTSLGAALVSQDLPKTIFFEEVSDWLLKCSSFEIAHISTKYLSAPVCITPLPKTLAGVFAVSSLRHILDHSTDLTLNSRGIPYTDASQFSLSRQVNIKYDVIDNWISNLLSTSLTVLNTQFGISTPISRVVFHGGLIPYLGSNYFEYFLPERVFPKSTAFDDFDIIFYS